MIQKLKSVIQRAASQDNPYQTRQHETGETKVQDPDEKNRVELAGEISYQYWANRKYQREIGSEFNRSAAWVSDIMDEFNIPTMPGQMTRDYSGYRGTYPDKSEFDNLDWLTPNQRSRVTRIMIDGASPTQVANEENVTRKSVKESVITGLKRVHTIRCQKAKSGDIE